VSETLVSLAEAAARKGVHYQTVRRAIARGALRAMKVGGGVIIAAADLDAWRPSYSHAPHQPRRGGRDSSGTGAAAPDGERSAEDEPGGR
jgi:excisionase family DNA binding protein